MIPFAAEPSLQTAISPSLEYERRLATLPRTLQLLSRIIIRVLDDVAFGLIGGCCLYMIAHGCWYILWPSMWWRAAGFLLIIAGLAPAWSLWTWARRGRLL